MLSHGIDIFVLFVYSFVIIACACLSHCDVVRHELVYQVLWRRVHWIDVTYMSKCLSIALSNHNFVALLDKFDAVLEFKRYLSLVIGLHVLLVKYFDSLHGLTNTSDVQDCLVTSLYVRVVVQHLDESVEVLDAECLVRVHALLLGRNRVYQARSFSDLVILDWLRITTNGLDVYAYRCHLTCLLNWHSVLVYTLDDDWSEITVSVRTEHHLLLKLDNTPEDSTAQNEANSSAEETRVNNELGVDLSLHR